MGLDLSVFLQSKRQVGGILESKRVKKSTNATHCEGDCALNQSSGLKFWSLKVNLLVLVNGF